MTQSGHGVSRIELKLPSRPFAALNSEQQGVCCDYFAVYVRRSPRASATLLLTGILPDSMAFRRGESWMIVGPLSPLMIRLPVGFEIELSQHQ